MHIKQIRCKHLYNDLLYFCFKLHSSIKGSGLINYFSNNLNWQIFEGFTIKGECTVKQAHVMIVVFVKLN